MEEPSNVPWPSRPVINAESPKKACEATETPTFFFTFSKPKHSWYRNVYVEEQLNLHAKMEMREIPQSLWTSDQKPNFSTSLHIFPNKILTSPLHQKYVHSKGIHHDSI
jgi:hypothetical protein